MTMNFGPLNGEGGHRRLNVAISRAREGVVIYSTLAPQQIDLSRVRAAGVRDLKHYLEFALKGPRALVAQSLPTGREPDSPFETQVIKVLRERGWVVHPQVGCSGYRIDMGVVDPRAPGRYLLGIECDGRAYHAGATARDRDRLRQVVLEGLGWRLHRIWSTDWWINPEREVDKLLARLDAELAREEEAPAPEPEPDPQPGPQSGSDEDDAAQADDVAFTITTEDGVDAAGSGTMPGQAPPRPNTAAGAITTYQVTDLAPGDAQAFYDRASNARLTAELRQVIETEGPLPESVLHRRVARAWGLERTGARIVERLRQLTPADSGRTHEGEVTFLWPAGARPAAWADFRGAGEDEASRRRVDDVCLEELANGVLRVLATTGNAPRADVIKSVCRLLGLSRTLADAEARLGLALSALQAQGRVRDDAGMLRVD